MTALTDQVKNERPAVKSLRTGVTRFAETMREAMALARKDLAAQRRSAEQSVESRRSQLQRAERELQNAKSALSQCRDNCGPLRARVSALTARTAECKQQLDKSRRAVQLIAQADHDLGGVMRGIESKVAEHSSLASSALADLDAKIATLRGTFEQHLRSAGTGLVVGAEIFGAGHGAAMDLSNAAHAFDISTSGGDASIADLVERQNETNRHYVLDETRKAESERLWGDLQGGD
ncbi:hypothetical protein D9V37_16295 [Nocardioides mangrovicus]|uniref:PspA/IM30 family protein n=1 Tax=Nocardioides mangrovicus TaxID=2478913 RepID=A0A3L8P013_9ACTN|nr:hypothetical protein [Nocardioides mangrovicus]RLV47708.1 hypothetical protein D9V37_16295 [Nocardioides mangrovicus]